MKLIYLTTGEITKVDDADYAYLNKHKWYGKSSAALVYVCRSVYDLRHPGTIRMHREIMSCPPDKEVDHKDGDPFNNQRSNLEIVTKRENIFRETKPLFSPAKNGNLTQP